VGTVPVEANAVDFLVIENNWRQGLAGDRIPRTQFGLVGPGRDHLAVMN
jgi:hypothetical protein